MARNREKRIKWGFKEMMVGKVEQKGQKMENGNEDIS